MADFVKLADAQADFAQAVISNASKLPVPSDQSLHAKTSKSSVEFSATLHWTESVFNSVDSS
jgi:hypothetical protein